MNTIRTATHDQVSPSAVSITLILCSCVWLLASGMCYASASRNDWSETPLFWMMISMLTPSLCFACGTVLARSRHHSQFSRLHWCALVASILPVTLGSWMAVWAVKALFGASIQEASIELKMFGALACLALVAVSGVLVWQAGMNLFCTKQDEKPAAC